MENCSRVELPLKQSDIRTLRAGDEVQLFGVAYTARDAAHKRLTQMLRRGEPLPFELFGASIYYAGPCPAAPGEVIGPCGPTTSSRMDVYTPMLIRKGITAMIGKGDRNDAVRQAMYERAVYFAATGGAGYFISQHITDAEVVAFPELGAEAICRVRFYALPVVVAIDAYGGTLFKRSANNS